MAQYLLDIGAGLIPSIREFLKLGSWGSHGMCRDLKGDCSGPYLGLCRDCYEKFHPFSQRLWTGSLKEL